MRCNLIFYLFTLYNIKNTIYHKIQSISIDLNFNLIYIYKNPYVFNYFLINSTACTVIALISTYFIKNEDFILSAMR